jgi:hypothetical protein
MAFIKNFRCRKCASSLGKWNDDRDHKQGSHCFVCGCSRFQYKLNWNETKGLDKETCEQLLGLEPGGWCGDILARINTPGVRLSSYQRAGSALNKESLVSEAFTIDVEPKEVREGIAFLKAYTNKLMKEKINAGVSSNSDGDNTGAPSGEGQGSVPEPSSIENCRRAA